MSFHEITKLADGSLLLEVEGAEVARILRRGDSLDLLFAIRGPKNLDESRRILTGLIDLVIQYDALPAKDKEKRK